MGYTPHVLVVGGGPLGAGLARDFAVRGLDVTLLAPGPLADSRAGRMGGLLASGAQFAREDPAHARRCLAENRTLFEVAGHCVEDTGGLVVDDSLEELAAACEDCSIGAQRLSGSEAREREPGLSPAVDGVLAVPDAAVDPSLLTVATARDAREYGADIRPRTAVTGIEVEDGAVDTAVVRHDPLSEHPGNRAGADGDSEPVRSDGGRSMPGTLDTDVQRQNREGDRPEPDVDRLDVDYIVNAAGADAAAVADLADCSVPVSQRTETVSVTADRQVETAVTRPVAGGEGRRPDAAVPVGRQTLLSSAETGRPTPAGVDALGESLGEILSAATGRRQLRAFGVPRDQFDAGDGRDFAVLDHDRQGCWGLLTVLGGTVTTHRWVAERVCDRVCQEFGIQRGCRTDELVLPGSEDVPDLAEAVGTFGLSESVYEQSKRRLGSETSAVLHTDGPNPVLCACRSVTRAEVQAALDDETGAETDLGGVRVRTFATTGRCQGGRCAHRLAAELHPTYEASAVEEACAALLAERWQGQRPVTGPQQTEMARSYRLHTATMNRGQDQEMGHEDIAAFDDGFREDPDRPTCCPRVGWEP